MTIRIEQPPSPLAEQKQVYEGELVVRKALSLTHEERGGMASERAVILRLMEAGWEPTENAIERSGRLLVTTGLQKYPQPAEVLRFHQETLLRLGYADLTEREDGTYLVPTAKARRRWA